MSMTGDPDDHDHDDEGEQELPPEIRAQFDLLIERSEKLIDKARQIGLYIEGHPQVQIVPTPGGMAAALVVQYTIGKVAFSDRVQNPEKDKFDDQFRVMEIEAQDDDFLDERQRIAKALDAGLDPYAPEDDG